MIWFWGYPLIHLHDLKVKKYFAHTVLLPVLAHFSLKPLPLKMPTLIGQLALSGVIGVCFGNVTAP